VSKPTQTWGNIGQDDALSRFKHEAYAFVLGKHVDYEDTKSIYLYLGSTRVAKVHLDPSSGQVEVWSAAIREWIACEEKLPQKRYPMLMDAFRAKYVKQHAWINTQTITFVRMTFVRI
jgi:hypothetical protein